MIEKKFFYKGYPCVVRFMEAGYRCGYVGINSQHPCYQVDYSELDDIECHGGLTYGSSYFPEDDIDMPERYWIGFDCGHSCDGVDVEQANKYFGHVSEIVKCLAEAIGGVAKSQEYVEEQCKKIVDQLEDKR